VYGRVVSGSEDRSVRVWDLASGAARVLEGHKHGVLALAMLPNGHMVSGSGGHTVRVWNPGSGAARVLEGHTQWVRALTVLSDGRVVSGSGDHTVRGWSKTHQLQHTFVADAPISCLTITPSGVVVGGCQDGTVQFLRLP
jgi:WD40 repeat protein